MDGPAPPKSPGGLSLKKTVGGAGKLVGNTVGGAAMLVGTGASKTIGAVGSGATKTIGVVGSGATKAIGVVGSGATKTIGVVGSGATKTIGVVGSGATKAIGAVGTGASAAVGAGNYLVRQSIMKTSDALGSMEMSLGANSKQAAQEAAIQLMNESIDDMDDYFNDDSKELKAEGQNGNGRKQERSISRQWSFNAYDEEMKEVVEDSSDDDSCVRILKKRASEPVVSMTAKSKKAGTRKGKKKLDDSSVTAELSDSSEEPNRPVVKKKAKSLVLRKTTSLSPKGRKKKKAIPRSSSSGALGENATGDDDSGGSGGQPKKKTLKGKKKKKALSLSQSEHIPKKATGKPKRRNSAGALGTKKSPRKGKKAVAKEDKEATMNKLPEHTAPEKQDQPTKEEDERAAEIRRQLDASFNQVTPPVEPDGSAAEQVPAVPEEEGISPAPDRAARLKEKLKQMDPAAKNKLLGLMRQRVSKKAAKSETPDQEVVEETEASGQPATAEDLRAAETGKQLDTSSTQVAAPALEGPDDSGTELPPAAPVANGKSPAADKAARLKEKLKQLDPAAKNKLVGLMRQKLAKKAAKSVTPDHEVADAPLEVETDQPSTAASQSQDAGQSNDATDEPREEAQEAEADTAGNQNGGMSLVSRMKSNVSTVKSNVQSNVSAVKDTVQSNVRSAASSVQHNASAVKNTVQSNVKSAATKVGLVKANSDEQPPGTDESKAAEEGKSEVKPEPEDTGASTSQAPARGLPSADSKSNFSARDVKRFSKFDSKWNAMRASANFIKNAQKGAKFAKLFDAPVEEETDETGQAKDDDEDLYMDGNGEEGAVSEPGPLKRQSTGRISVEAADRRLAGIEELEHAIAKERAELAKEREKIAFERESLELQLEEEARTNETLTVKLEELEEKLAEKEEALGEASQAHKMSELSVENEALKAQLNVQKRGEEQLVVEKDAEIEKLKETIRKMQLDENTEEFSVNPHDGKSRERLQGELLHAASKLSDRDSTIARQNKEISEMQQELSGLRSGQGVEDLNKANEEIRREKEDIQELLEKHKREEEMKLASKDETIAFLIEELGTAKKATSEAKSNFLGGFGMIR